jgi:hypothetical protein
MDWLRMVAAARTPQELHRACFLRGAQGDWRERRWGFYLADDLHMPDHVVLGCWKHVHSAETGRRVPPWAFLVDLDGADPWEAAVDLGFPLLARTGEGCALLPPDTSGSRFFGGDPVEAMGEAFGIVLGVGRAGQMERLLLATGPEIPGFPKVYGGGGLSVKGQDLKVIQGGLRELE